jgi:predicted nucleotidyltransferase
VVDTAALTPRIPIDREALLRFCEKWKITRLEFFGSVLRDDFGPDSDVDVMVTFERNYAYDMDDLLGAQEGLSELFGRPVDVLTRAQVEESENRFRRPAILNGARDVIRR